MSKLRKFGASLLVATSLVSLSAVPANAATTYTHDCIYKYPASGGWTKWCKVDYNWYEEWMYGKRDGYHALVAYKI